MLNRMARLNYDRLPPSVADGLRSIEEEIRHVVYQSKRLTIIIRKMDEDIQRIKWALVSRARFVISSVCRAKQMETQAADGSGDSCHGVSVRILEARRILNQAKDFSLKLDQFKLEKCRLTRCHRDLMCTVKEMIFQWKRVRSTSENKNV